MIIFTDGSTFNNGKKNAIGGIGIYIPKLDNQDECKISYSLLSFKQLKVTNQISELIATIIAIEKAISITHDTIYIYTDSKYVIDCATTWSKSWINNKWKKSNGKIIDNLWLIYRLIQLTKKYPVIFKHIKAHQDQPNNVNNELYKLWLGNKIADELAVEASKSAIELVNSVKILNWETFALFIINGMNKDIKINIPYHNDITTFYKLLLYNGQNLEDNIETDIL